jgi:polyisoprenoid-binding protein YceI
MNKLILLLALFICPKIAIAAGTCTAHAEAFVGILEFDITDCHVSGWLEHDNAKGIVKGFFEVKLDELETGLDMRNKHMKEKYLETAKYPLARFKLDPLRIGDSTFSGQLQFHGTHNKISGKVIKSTAKNLTVEFDLDVTQYGIKVPEYKGITLAKRLKVTVVI